MEGKRLGMGVVYGLVGIIISVLVFAMLFVFILRYTSVSEGSLAFIFQILSFAIVMGGGIIAGLYAKRKGFLAGLMTGFMFGILIFIAQYLGYDQLFSAKQWLLHAGYCTIAMLGGMIGAGFTKST